MPHINTLSLRAGRLPLPGPPGDVDCKGAVQSPEHQKGKKMPNANAT